MSRIPARRVRDLREYFATMNEAAREETAEVEFDEGLTLGLLDMDDFVRLNDLKEVTNPIYLVNGTSFTPDGLLSQEIFGTSTEERRQRFAYIDLHGHYMYPLAGAKLAAYDRTLADCLYARGRYKLVNGRLESDPEGESGPEFLYDVWPKLKPIPKTTESTKAVAKFFAKPRDELFIDKLPVIPPFFRDINVSETSSSKSSSILNSKYSSIISYCQSIRYYTDSFSSMARLTRARVQTLIQDIYQELMIHTVKGSPAKFGMLRRAMGGKNLPYTARMVITAPNLQKPSVERVQVRFGYATIPLAQVCALFMPFMVHELRRFFDAEFIQGGTRLFNAGKDTEQLIFRESYDESAITNMITKYIHSPSTRFDEFYTPKDMDGKVHRLFITGRFNESNTTFNRPATITDILFITAMRVVQDKHVYITRYPMDNPYGQNPFRIIVSTTVETTPVTIGNTVYEFYPVIGGDPLNVMLNTCQFSNTMIGPMGADFDIEYCRVMYCDTPTHVRVRNVVTCCKKHCERPTSGVYELELVC